MRKISRMIVEGALLGIAIGFLIALSFSLLYQTADFYPSAPRFVALFNSKLIATGVATILWALIGIVFNCSSLIFEQAQWSVTKQTIVHLLITYCLFTPLAIISGWFPLNWLWMGLFTLIFAAIYTSIWISSMISARATIARINHGLAKRQNMK